MRRTIKRTVDLYSQKSTVDYVDSSAFYYNDQAHDWVVEVLNNGVPAELEGTVQVYVQRPDGSWVGCGYATIDGNIVTGTFIQACYLQVGQVLCVMRYTEGGTMMILDTFYTRVQNTIGDDTPIVPTSEMILWDDVEEKLELLDEAIAHTEEVMPPSFPSVAGKYVLQVHVESGQTPQSEWLPNEGIIAEDDGNGNVTIRYNT